MKDGIVIAVGTEEEVFKLQDDATKLIDLEGRTMLPGFVDAHGHVMGGGLQALSANLLAPPDGEVKDIAALQQTLKDWMEANKEAVDKIQLVVGFGYDNSQLAELRHPNREDLDAAFTNLLLEMSGANLPAASAGGAFTSPPCVSCACGALSQLMDAAAIGECPGSGASSGSSIRRGAAPATYAAPKQQAHLDANLGSNNIHSVAGRRERLSRFQPGLGNRRPNLRYRRTQQGHRAGWLGQWCEPAQQRRHHYRQLGEVGRQWGLAAGV